MIKKHFIIFILGLCVIAGACTQEKPPCVEPILVSLRFSVWSTHSVTDSAVLPPVTIRVPFDTVLPGPVLTPLDATSNVNYFFGPFATQLSVFLNPNADSCRWVLTQDSGRTIIDTLTFYYTRKLQFLSNACGYTYYYDLTNMPSTPNLKNGRLQNPFDTAYHRIDSITIENTSVTNNVNLEHLRIYIRNPF